MASVHTPSNHTPWLETLRKVVARDGLVHVTPTPIGEQDEGGQTCGVRLLALSEDGSMLIEMPSESGLAGGVEPGDEMEVLVAEPAQRWVGQCVVAGAVDYPLNATTQVRALRLKAASTVESGQRRQLFRADTSGVELPPVRLSLMQGRLAPVGQSVEARLLNISGRGAGLVVSVDAPEVKRLLRGEQYRCEFELPPLPEAMVVHARLVHLAPMRKGMLYLGLEFEFESDARRRQVEDPIMRFATEMQRQQIRRQRGG